MKKILAILIMTIAAVLCTTDFVTAQNRKEGVKVTDSGSFSGLLNGSAFETMIRYGEAENLVTISTGNESFTLTLNFKNVSSIAEIKTGTYKLPNDDRATVLFVDNKMAVPFIITKGTLSITENDGKTLKGKLEFSAAAGGIPKEMGGKETSLTDGKFEITKKK